MRKYMRDIARRQMHREGVVHENRQRTGTSRSGVPVKLGSFFANHWREYFASAQRRKWA